MKLKYRGISYEYHPSQVPMEESQDVGTYRGVTFHFHTWLKSFSQLPLDLTYRGVPYHSISTAELSL